MLPIFGLTIILFSIIGYYRRKATRIQEDANEAFWKREVEANSTRRQDISNLPYISIPVENFPLDLGTESEETIKRLAGQRVINLTPYTNTDLKLQYGVANLEDLSLYESNYVELEKALSTYADELLEAQRKPEAIQVLEFAVDCSCDLSHIYLTLANLYQEGANTDGIQTLIAKANSLETLSREPLVQKLQAYLP